MATPGTYIVTACITPGTMVQSGGSPQCVVTGKEVCGSTQFKFPSNDVLTGTVGQ